MNSISLLSTNDDGLTFCFLVDEQLLGEILGAPGNGIPHRYIVDSLPSIPPYPNVTPTEPSLRLVAVCTCGEFGCGHTKCRIRYTEQQVSMSEFVTKDKPSTKNHSFRFDSNDFNRVISRMIDEANRFRRETY